MALTKHTLFYDTVDVPPAQARALSTALEELSDLLKRPPLLLAVALAPLPSKLRASVQDILASEPDVATGIAIAGDLLFDTPRTQFRRLIIGCHEDHKLACKVRRNNPDALWGGAICPIALAFLPCSRFVVWHECLHLFGTKDCYMLPDTGPTCELENCIMQYEPTDATVGAWPFLCKKNIGRLRRVRQRTQRA